MSYKRIAIPTKGKKGLKDTVSEIFGRNKYFTIIELKNGSVEGVKVLDNPYMEYKHGTGPLVVKMLADQGINVVISSEIGPGVSIILAEYKIELIKIKENTLVSEVLNSYEKKD